MNTKEKFPKSVWPPVSAFFVFLVYLFSTGTTVSFYRDSGELITAASTLSIAHSPGYPLYMIVGKVFTDMLSFLGASPAYAMNIFSAGCGALAVYFIILAVRELTDNIYAAEFTGLLAAFTYINWMLAVVAEMYSFSFMLGALLFYLMIKKKYLLFSFIFALSLGNHLSILFAVLPMAAALYFFTSERQKIPFKSAVFYFILGFSVYLYLPIRAVGGPFINWGNPSNFKSFIDVITRSGYGHTLDLISREVTLAQVYFPQLKNLFAALLRDFNVAGLLIALTGIYYGFKKERYRKLSWVLLFIFILTGPYFLYLARMPVNPHANAIIEVGYQFPELVIAVFAGLGLTFFIQKLKTKRNWYLYAIAFLVVAYNIFNIYPKANKRGKFFADDYAVNILSTVEEGSIVIMRRDHTMFALWYKNYIENFRPSVKVISKGLLSARWYREKLRKTYPDISWEEEYLSDSNYIDRIVSGFGRGYTVYMTPSAVSEMDDSFFKKYKLLPYGLVEKVSLKESSDPELVLNKVLESYQYRGEYKYDRHYDFFSKDFISLYAKSYDRLGTVFLSKGLYGRAEDLYRKALTFTEKMSEPYSNLGYIYLQRKDFSKAAQNYQRAIELLKDEMSEYTRKEHFKGRLASHYNNLGTVYEKKYSSSADEKYINLAEKSYKKAIEFKKNFSQAYFNMGVLYWDRNWTKAARNFRLAAEYDPTNKSAVRYYNLAREKGQNLRKSR